MPTLQRKQDAMIRRTEPIIDVAPSPRSSEDPIAAPERTPPTSRRRLIAALVWAVVVDILQAPATLAWLTVVGGPIEWVLNEGVDFVTFGVLSRLIGFHWIFLPAFLVESLPGVDILPTWTASLYLVKGPEIRSLFLNFRKRS